MTRNKNIKCKGCKRAIKHLKTTERKAKIDPTNIYCSSCRSMRFSKIQSMVYGTGYY